jgi:Plasmid recombination enzyme
MPYAIVRIAKLKQVNIAGSGMHVSRGRNTPNANASMFEENQTLIYYDDRHLPLKEVVHQKIHSVPQKRKIRTDAVHCVEILLTASPEYFRPDDPSKYGDYQADKLADWKAATVDWLKQEYGDKIVRAELHLDEATPHIHAYLVPTDENGQLNCKKIFGGRAKMFAFQDSYAAATKHLGLERGVRNSQAEHTTVKDYYSVVNAASQELDINDLSAVQARAVAYAQMQKDHQELERRLKYVADQRDLLSKKLEQTQEALKVQSQVNRSLNTPESLVSLARVACELRLSPGAFNKQMKPINLVMENQNTDLIGAAYWLTEKFGAAATIGLVNEQVSQLVTEQLPGGFIPPRPERDKWGEVKDNLTKARGLPAKLVERLHDEGLIYADEEGKLICLDRDFEERVTGAVAIDLGLDELGNDSKLIHSVMTIDGSKLTGGWCYFQAPRQGAIDLVVVLEDVLEAMAYATLKAEERNTLFLVGHEGGWMPGEQLERVDVVVATRAELSNLPEQVEYELPESGSWGEDLQAYLAGAMELEEVEQSGELEVSAESIAVRVTINPNYVDQEEKEEERHQYRGLSM